MKKRYALKLIAACAIAASATAAFAQDVIKIANIVELSGGGATAGTNFKNGVELAVKEREASQPPLYQVMFVLLEGEPPRLHLGEAQSRPLTLDTQTSKSELTLGVQAGEHTWDCQWEYATDLFTEETVARSCA